MNKKAADELAALLETDAANAPVPERLRRAADMLRNQALELRRLRRDRLGLFVSERARNAFKIGD